MASNGPERNKSKNYYFMLMVGIPIIAFLIIGSQFMWKENYTLTEIDKTNIPEKFENFAKDELTVSLRTDSSKYIPGQIHIIRGSIFNSTGVSVNANVDFIIESNKTKEVFTSTFSKDGKFRVTDVSFEKPGIYTVYAKAVEDENIGYAQTTFHVVEFYKTKLGIGIIATIVFIISLLILIFIQTKVKLRITSIEPLRFAFLTLCSLIPIISLLAADAQIGQDSPLGLVVREIPNPVNISDLNNPESGDLTVEEFIKQNTIQKFEWVIHVGGSPHDNYLSGIIIPTYVFIFGMLGGYIRFLHKTASGWFVPRATKEWNRLNPHKKKDALKKELISLATKADNPGYLREPPKGKTEDKGEIEEDEALIKRIIFNNSMEDLALIFLSPILAFVTFFILKQGGIDPISNMPTMAIASFGTGLITNEIITRLENIASSTLNNTNNNKDDSESDQNNNKDDSESDQNNNKDDSESDQNNNKGKSSEPNPSQTKPKGTLPKGF